MALGACAGPMQIDAPAPRGDDAARCRQLVDALPRSLAGQSIRTVQSTGAVAAWGDPAIVLRCGTSAASGLGPASRCAVLDGVAWYAENLGEDYRFTTIGRASVVEVTVPHTYAPESGPLLGLATAVKRTDPVVHRCV